MSLLKSEPEVRLFADIKPYLFGHDNRGNPLDAVKEQISFTLEIEIQSAFPYTYSLRNVLDLCVCNAILGKELYGPVYDFLLLV